MHLSFLCRTGTARSTQGWAAPRPAAAAACGEAAPVPPPGIPQPTGTALTDPGGTRSSCSMRRGTRAGLCSPPAERTPPQAPNLCHAASRDWGTQTLLVLGLPTSAFYTKTTRCIRAAFF